MTKKILQTLGLLLGCFLMLGILATSNLMASEVPERDEGPTTEDTEVTEVTNITNEHYSTQNTYNQSDGVAAAMAMSSLQFDYNVSSWQFAVGGSAYDDSQGRTTHGMAFGGAKRVCTADGCGLLNVSTAINEGGGRGGAVSFTWNL